MRCLSGWFMRRSGGRECVEDVGWLVAEVAVRGGDVGAAAESDDVDRGVAESGHVLWSVAGSGAGVVFPLGYIADAVEPVLDRPVRPDPGGQQPWVGVAVIQGGQRVDRLHR